MFPAPLKPNSPWLEFELKATFCQGTLSFQQQPYCLVGLVSISISCSAEMFPERDSVVPAEQEQEHAACFPFCEKVQTNIIQHDLTRHL